MDSELSPRPHDTELPISLLQLLSNSLILYQTTPYLPIPSLLALAATSKSFKGLIESTPNVFRYLNLTNVKSAQFEIAAIDHGGEVWRNVQLDENVTEDDFYGGPLCGILNILRRRNIISDVQILVLDGLSVTSDIVSDIILHEYYNVRLLSIREVKNLNERKLQQALLYALRPSRSASVLKLQGLYIFGPKDRSPAPRMKRHVNYYPPGIAPIDTLPSYGGVVYSQGAQIGAQWNQKSGDTLADEIENGGDKWYQGNGKVMDKSPSLEWATTMLSCQGLISFDAVLCSGPRHSIAASTADEDEKIPWYRNSSAHVPARVATHSVGGCDGCVKAPEGQSKFGISPLSRFPLLAPPPLHSSTLKAAKQPFSLNDDQLLVRCMDCLKGRFCESCHKWWCEDCYEVPENSFSQWGAADGALGGHPEKTVKVHMGLCVDCLRSEMMSGAGSNGMWV